MVETKFQTSFIPKQPVTGEAEHTKRGVGILFLISFLLLVASIAGAIGVFVWNKTVIANTEKGRKQLEDHKNAFDPTSIKVFTDLDNRIDVASTLLHSHVAASEIFPRLQVNTLKTVRFNNFSYTNGGNGKIIINMSGEAQDYESMALQAQQFTKPELRDSFKGPIFSNFSKSKDTVVFTFSSGIDPYVIDYYQSRTSALRQEASTQSPTLPVSGTNR
jgi:hypothetical protein